VTGTILNVATVLAGTLVGTLLGGRLPQAMHDRVLAGLGLVTLVLGVDLALAWRDTSVLYVLGGVLLGGLAGEAVGIEDRIAALGDRLQAVSARGDERSTVSEAFFTASLLFCVGPLTVVGAIQDGLTGDYEALATKALLDGFASIVLTSAGGVRERLRPAEQAAQRDTRCRSCRASHVMPLWPAQREPHHVEQHGFHVRPVRLAPQPPRALPPSPVAVRPARGPQPDGVPSRVGTSRRKPGVRTRRTGEVRSM
jgi:hypothetical protein